MSNNQENKELQKTIASELLLEACRIHTKATNDLNDIYSKYHEASKDYPHYAFSNFTKWNLSKALTAEAKLKMIYQYNKFFKDGSLNIEEFQAIEDFGVFIDNFMKSQKDFWVRSSMHCQPSSTNPIENVANTINTEVGCANYERYEAIVKVESDNFIK